MKNQFLTSEFMLVAHFTVWFAGKIHSC
jgi:hypothetical protein